MTKLEEVSIVGISLDSRENTIVYAKEKALEIPIYYPSDEEIFKKNNKVAGVPTTIIVDEKGYVENLWTGLLSKNEAADVVEAILN